MSTSAPEIGLPFWSLTTQLTKRAGPGVGERTIDPPFSVRGEFMRQNGQSAWAILAHEFAAHRKRWINRALADARACPLRQLRGQGPERQTDFRRRGRHLALVTRRIL